MTGARQTIAMIIDFRKCNKNSLLHNEELSDLYSSPNIVRVIKSRRMRWAGHVARMGEERGRKGLGKGNRRERDH